MEQGLWSSIVFCCIKSQSYNQQNLFKILSEFSQVIPEPTRNQSKDLQKSSLEGFLASNEPHNCKEGHLKGSEGTMLTLQELQHGGQIHFFHCFQKPKNQGEKQHAFQQVSF